jgi:hypothetical protein
MKYNWVVFCFPFWVVFRLGGFPFWVVSILDGFPFYGYFQKRVSGTQQQKFKNEGPSIQMGSQILGESSLYISYPAN